MSVDDLVAFEERADELGASPAPRVRPLPFRSLFKRLDDLPSRVRPVARFPRIIRPDDLAFAPAVAKYEHADDRGQAAAASATREELKDLLRAVLERSSNMEGPDRGASERARALYLRGRLIECTADQGDADGAKALVGAEEALKKAAKLNPTLEGAWICLGQLLWKKGNLDGAKNCYAAVTSRAPNKKASQCMSMLCRTIAKAKATPGTDEQKEHVVESLKHAKDAIKLDVTDGYSWYQCGMAYMTQFFAEGATDPNKLSQSLQCFASAEKGGPAGDGSLEKGGIGDYPDLHFNRATVQRYVEEYASALEGFKRAAQLDPQLPWKGEVDAMLAVLTKLDDGCAGQGPMFKPKRLLPIQKTLAEARASAAPEEYRGGSLKALAPGVNKGVCVNVRAALDATAEDMLNLHYIVVDGDGTLAALSVYGLEDGAVRQSSTLTLLDPNVKDVDATWEGRRFKFRLVRVDLPKQILVGGTMPVGLARPRLASVNL